MFYAIGHFASALLCIVMGGYYALAVRSSAFSLREDYKPGVFARWVLPLLILVTMGSLAAFSIERGLDPQACADMCMVGAK